MSILVETILKSLKDGALKQISEKSGITPQQGQVAAQSALPMILEFASKSFGGGAQAQSGALLQSLTSALTTSSGSAPGGDLLKALLGSELNSFTSSLQQKAGLNQSQASSFLTNFIPVIVKALSSSGANGGNLASLISGASSHLSASGGASKLLSGALDQDGDGDVDMSDMLKVGAGLMGGLLKK